jgi:hypothetical protein
MLVCFTARNHGMACNNRKAAHESASHSYDGLVLILNGNDILLCRQRRASARSAANCRIERVARNFTQGRRRRPDGRTNDLRRLRRDDLTRRRLATQWQCNGTVDTATIVARRLCGCTLSVSASIAPMTLCLIQSGPSTGFSIGGALFPSSRLPRVTISGSDKTSDKPAFLSTISDNMADTPHF